MKTLFLMFTASLALFTAGCVVQRVVWSPNGAHAAVLGEKGIYFCDSKGNLSGMLASNVVNVKWFPDSRRLALIYKISDKLLDVRVGTFQENQLAVSPVLLSQETLASESTRISPGGTAIALATGQDKGHGARLTVLSADGSAPPQIVSDDACQYPDWSKDGRSLVYIRAVGQPSTNDEVVLGCLTQRTVLDADGKLQALGPNVDFAGVLFDPETAVRCLSDGRIMFISFDVHLPATAPDMPQKPTLFVFDPQKQATISRPLPHSMDELIQNSAFLDISPDEKKLLVAGQKGAVSIITLATGEVAIVQGPGTEDATSFPSWRGDDVCFLVTAPTNSEGRIWEVALWNTGNTRIISAKCPEALRASFLNK